MLFIFVFALYEVKFVFLQNDLVRHTKVHEPPNEVCQTCGARFRWKKQLDKHILTHSEVWPNYFQWPFVLYWFPAYFDVFFICRLLWSDLIFVISAIPPMRRGMVWLDTCQENTTAQFLKDLAGFIKVVYTTCLTRWHISKFFFSLSSRCSD